MYTTTLRVGIPILLALCGNAQAADFAIIVNKANASTVDRAQVTKMYTGDLKAWADGSPIVLLDLPESDPLRAQFATDVAGKSLSSLKSLWAQHAFSGRALPPKVLESDAEVKKLVAANRNAVGYVKSTSVDDSVRTVK